MVLAWGPIGAATAQAPVDEEATAAARALFEDGVRLADAGDHQQAADRFRRSLQLRRSLVVAYNLASSLVQIGRLVEASEVVRSILRDADAPARLRAAAEELLDRVTPQIGRLTVHVTGHSEGVEVRMDGEPVPSVLVGVPRPVDPGGHTVSIHRGGTVLGSRDVSIEPGGVAEVSLEAPPPVPTPEEVVQRQGDERLVLDLGSGARSSSVAVATQGGRSVAEEPAFWVGVGGGLVAVAVAAIVIGVVATQEPAPVPGDFDPPVVEVR
jgi:hypothetical protein